MKQPEISTSINEINAYKENVIVGAYQQSQVPNLVVKDIADSQRRIKPWIPTKYCQYPQPSKTDDYSLSEGLGTVTLQPTIDQLNAFKTYCINTIKTKFQAMGPENTKDSALAAGAVDLILQVYQAASCFSKQVSNVNRLISSYISAIDLLVLHVVDNINDITAEVQTIKRSLLKFPGQIANQVIISSLELLQRETSVFTMLTLVNGIQTEFNKSMIGINKLSNTPERTLLHFEASLTLLQGSLQRLQYFLSMKDILSANKDKANSSFMTDNFLDDFNFTDSIQEASYNWSITNSNILTSFNTIDSKRIITNLNNLFQNYSSNSKPLLIDSREQNGTIVVPDGDEGIISVGMDWNAGINVGLILQLIINNGETIIIAESYGGESTTSEDVPVNIVLGKYYNKGDASFTYSRYRDNGTSIELFQFDENATLGLNVDDLVYYTDTITQETLSGYWQLTSNQNGDRITCPVLFKVIDKTNNSITIKILGQEDISVTNFSSDISANDASLYTLYLPISPTPQQTIMGTSLINGDGLPISATLQRYSMTESLIPHAGEKIKCKNWSLYITPIGDIEEIRKISFSQKFLTDTITLFGIKAHWGFIPD